MSNIIVVTIAVFALPFVGFCLAIYLFWFWYPTFVAKRELRQYFESAKETFVYDGGLMHDAEFRSSEHIILVRFPKPAQRFQAEVKGSIMIKNVDGKYFHLDFQDVPENVKRFWRNCQNK